jgi:hypothetical protein
LCEKKFALKPTFASHLKKDNKQVFGDVDMTTCINFLELNKSLENISCLIIFHLVFYMLNIIINLIQIPKPYFINFHPWNLDEWNQNLNELYFMDGIKLLMAFHGSELYFIKWISSFIEIYHSSLKFPSWKCVNRSSCNIHSLKIHKWYSMDVWIVLECMDNL